MTVSPACLGQQSMKYLSIALATVKAEGALFRAGMRTCVARHTPASQMNLEVSRYAQSCLPVINPRAVREGVPPSSSVSPAATVDLML